MITPAMRPWLHAAIAEATTRDASNVCSDRWSNAIMWVRDRMGVPPDVASHHRKATRLLRNVACGSRKSLLIAAHSEYMRAAERRRHLADACRGKRPDLECVFVRINQLDPRFPASLIPMWLPPADVAMLRLEGVEVHRG